MSLLVNFYQVKKTKTQVMILTNAIISGSLKTVYLEKY